MAQTVKDPPAIQETRVQSLGQEDNLEKGMATHSIMLQSMELEKVGHDLTTEQQQLTISKIIKFIVLMGPFSL